MSRNIYMPNINEAVVRELKEISKKLDRVIERTNKETVKEYYLWDKFYSRNDDADYSYLNYNDIDRLFSLSSKIESDIYKTKFTDEDIASLGIPLDRFEKEEVQQRG